MMNHVYKERFPKVAHTHNVSSVRAHKRLYAPFSPVKSDIHQTSSLISRAVEADKPRHTEYYIKAASDSLSARELRVGSEGLKPSSIITIEPQDL